MGILSMRSGWLEGIAISGKTLNDIDLLFIGRIQIQVSALMKYLVCLGFIVSIQMRHSRTDSVKSFQI